MDSVLKKLRYSIVFSAFLWVMWLCGALMQNETPSTVLSDAFKFWILAPIMPLGFLGWISLLSLEETTIRVVADIFPGWEILPWVWLPFIGQMIVVWFVANPVH